MKILNIAAGKFLPLDLPEKDPYILVNLDTMYYTADTPEDVEDLVLNWDTVSSRILYCNVDAFEFMERTRIIFDRVCIYRFLEHVPMDKVLYFIYLLSTVVRISGTVDIIVPNYAILANMILKEDVTNQNFEAHNIELTTELLNDPSCPHASIWTVDRAKYFFYLEERFLMDDYVSHYDFDGRNIYLRFWLKRWSHSMRKRV